MLGIGFAATRDIVDFFRHAAADADGTANPVAGCVMHGIALGPSQSGNFIKTFVHLGFNEDAAGRSLFDGVLPYIAGRQLSMNVRFAAPGGAAGLYEPGSEPALWWGRTRTRSAGAVQRASWTDASEHARVRRWSRHSAPRNSGDCACRPVSSVPTRDTTSRFPATSAATTCRERPTAGEAAVFRSRRPATSAARSLRIRIRWATRIVRLVAALIEWVVKGTEPPPSRYPTLADGQLAPAATVAAAFPKIPGVAVPEVNHLLDYDFGDAFEYRDISGVIGRLPPSIRKVMPTLVPRVNEDGNEIAGVASPLHQAPLGSYLGWNITASGFFKGQICGFAGGYIPFAATRAEREKAGDPRRSVEERYGTQEGYVCAVTRAADALVRDRFLLRDDADRQIADAGKSRILPSNAESGAEARRIADTLCR